MRVLAKDHAKREGHHMVKAVATIIGIMLTGGLTGGLWSDNIAAAREQGPQPVSKLNAFRASVDIQIRPLMDT